ncbi:hypothetical protein CL617_04380 [archaeon]|nr:hypothetical protein [archaeon]|tara:strand:+ start:9561 stop:10313 length:753 start_codon:yes stop_codon:yes gene_type:complete
MRYKPILLLAFIFLLQLSIVNAQEVTVDRVLLNEVRYNEDLRISLSLTNNLAVKKTFELNERLPVNVELIQPAQPTEVKNFNAVEVMFLKWDVELNPSESKVVSYTIRPQRVGEFTIVGAEVLDLTSASTYSGIQSPFDVSCILDNICNLDIGENYQTCVADCDTGLGDGICNAIPDNQCDPDCTSDPDCTGSGFNIWYVIIPVILVIIGFLIYFFKKPNQGIPDAEQPRQNNQPQNPKQPQKPNDIMYS